jgi:DNA-directed RNA polymerase subunit RPC12/RpoP
MAFERKGTNEPIIGIIKFNEKKATELKCPHCGAVVGCEQNGIKQVASLKVIGRLEAVCPSCGKKFEI